MFKLMGRKIISIYAHKFSYLDLYFTVLGTLALCMLGNCACFIVIRFFSKLTFSKKIDYRNVGTCQELLASFLNCGMMDYGPCGKPDKALINPN